MSVDEQIQLFQKLTNASGAPGFEGEVRDLLQSYLSPLSDEIVTDRLGSLFGKKAGPADGPKLMAAGHMDEVGFMVTRITSEGFIKFETLGGWWEQVLLGQRVTLYTGEKKIEGIIGSKPPHILPPEERKKPAKMKQMFIDIGAANKEEVEALGIQPGTPIVPTACFHVMANPKYLMAKAWDNRFGCALSVELMKAVQGKELPNTLYAGATVQEEVGLRGALTSANTIEPDLFFAFDAGPCLDTPGITPDVTYSKLGGGAAIRIYDRSMVTHRRLREFVLDIAEKHNVPYQFFASPGGGTDAGRAHITGKGVPSIGIGIASRYIHSHASIMHRDDFDAALQLMTHLVPELDRSTFDWIIG
jgi:putative aminopeptidase FrvX